MLVLSRKTGERIWIGDEISITVVRVNGGGVRIGIDAPPHLPVMRDELKQRIDRANAQVDLDEPSSVLQPPSSDET